MAENTPNLSLYLKDPIADGNDTFNIETMLNENFRKIDSSIGGKANSTDVTSEKVNVISAKAVSDLPAAYPNGVSVFTLSSTAAAAWRTEIGHSANNAAIVETSKVTGGTTGEYLIFQKVSFYSSTLGQEKITAVYQRSSGANNSWKSTWQKVVSPEEFASHQAERASNTEYGHVMIGNGINVNDGVISVAEMTATNVSTTDGNVQTEIDSLKSSVSDGKTQVKNAITGKGGTVLDADGDGIPSFSELSAGVNGITTAAITVPNGTAFSGKRLAGLDASGNFYAIDLVKTPNTAVMYDKNFNLIKEITLPYSVRAFSKDYVVDDDSGAGLMNLRDHNKNLIQTIPAGGARTMWGAVGNNLYAYYTSSAKYARLTDFNGTYLVNVNDTSYHYHTFLNKKGNIIFLKLAGLGTNFTPIEFWKYVPGTGIVKLLATDNFYYGLDIAYW
ncbi:hypothetical protein [Mesobacillus stamsii]|uniref:Tail fiber protein n=1 Tax=Mesobacillus stamsii TaxID=225347 RepID=A0ABU0FSM7_9BACI|nr:hypothetical protein [Mesobacillus stamsii]MDQ0412735.1 hypothetical protein [Mesobacillus stamsii]